MSSIVRFDGENDVEIFINTLTGESFCSVKGYARMSGRDKGTISRRLQGVASSTEKTAEVPTGGGIQGVALIDENLIVEWLPRDNPAAASALLRLGVRMGLHKMAGYEVSTTATQSRPPVSNAPNYRKVAATAESIRKMTSGLSKAGLNPLAIETYILDQTAMLHPEAAQVIEAAKALIPEQPQPKVNRLNKDAAVGDIIHDWFLASNNPETPWYAPSERRITATNMYNSYREYCFQHKLKLENRRVLAKHLLALGAKRIESNFIYWILPERPE